MNKLVMRLQEIFEISKLSLAWCLSRFSNYKHIWLISERGSEARDNGYFFFVWLKRNHPEIHSKYVITKSSPDYKKLIEWEQDVVEFGSFQHRIAICSSDCLISTHVCGYTTDRNFYNKFDRTYGVFRHKKKVFLQHGIIKDRLPGFFADQTALDLFVCGSKFEHEYILEEFGYDNKVAQLTGLCRYDTLHDYHEKKQVLIMPTWRGYIDKEKFEESDYYKHFSELLSSSILSEIAEKNNYSIVFYPHFEYQSKIDSFKKFNLPSNVIIADMAYDVQTLLKESSILITDYSSVFFDMMYMRKPILFYQFDLEIYRKHHYQKGYLNYEDVGPVFDNQQDMLDFLSSLLEGTADMRKYLDYANQTFPIHDVNNCERVYNAIMRIEK